MNSSLPTLCLCLEPIFFKFASFLWPPLRIDIDFHKDERERENVESEECTFFAVALLSTKFRDCIRGFFKSLPNNEKKDRVKSLFIRNCVFLTTDVVELCTKLASNGSLHCTRAILTHYWFSSSPIYNFSPDYWFFFPRKDKQRTISRFNRIAENLSRQPAFVTEWFLNQRFALLFQHLEFFVFLYRSLSKRDDCFDLLLLLHRKRDKVVFQYPTSQARQNSNERTPLFEYLRMCFYKHLLQKGKQTWKRHFLDRIDYFKVYDEEKTFFYNYLATANIYWTGGKLIRLCDEIWAD